MDNSIKDIIRKRRSVRTFDERPLSVEDKEKLTGYLKECDNPFGVSVEFRFLDAKEHELTSPVIVGADSYIGIKMKNEPLYEVACGYSFEKMCLYALSLGIGTVILAGTFNRKAFEKAMTLKDDEVMPVASPLGYPAEHKSVRETVMRKAIKADERLPYEKLFFANSFSNAIKKEQAGVFADALEAVRLAPSAVNKQPWRAVVCGDAVHFFEKHAKSLTGDSMDVQKIDIGIALAHFDLTMQENGIHGTFTTFNPDVELDNLTEYIISYQINR